jgi:V8-like Glu-specific endopeptidase
MRKRVAMEHSSVKRTVGRHGGHAPLMVLIGSMFVLGSLLVGANAAGADPSAAPRLTSPSPGSAIGADPSSTIPSGNSGLAQYWNRYGATARDETVVSVPDDVTQTPQFQPPIDGSTLTVPPTTGSLSQADSGPSVPSGAKTAFGRYVYLTNGKLFFTDHNGQHFDCSGVLVNSPGKDLVITAGHCVYGNLCGLDPGEGWHSDFSFAPDFNGTAPYGWWIPKSGQSVWTLTAYYNSVTSPNTNCDEPDDLGAIVLNTNSAGQKAVNLLGGQGYKYNGPGSEFVDLFGYPLQAPYNGTTFAYCAGTATYTAITASVNMMLLPCSFAGGSSGGPWLISINRQGLGYVNSVSDCVYDTIPNEVAGMYFGNNFLSLYNDVKNL